MAKTKHHDDSDKKSKLFCVYLTNGTQFDIRAERFQVLADDFRVRFFDEHGEVIEDTYVARAEVAAIVPAHRR